MSYYLLIAGGRIVGCILFLMSLAKWEMQTAWSRIWTRVPVFISFDNNYKYQCFIFENPNIFCILRTQHVILKTCRRRWMIGRSGERGSGISMLAEWHDDDDEHLIYPSIWILFMLYIDLWQHVSGEFLNRTGSFIDKGTAERNPVNWEPEGKWVGVKNII